MNNGSNAASNVAPDARGAEADILASETFRHLRLMLVALPALMAIAIVALGIDQQWRPSISDYYLSPIRDVFVGCLVGSAVCLVVYKGSPPFEDYTLNVAGFYAIFVAFVPTRLTETLGTLSSEDREKAIDGLRYSIGAVVAIAIIFIALEWLFGHWTISRLLPNHRQASKLVFALTTAVGVAFLVLVFMKGVREETFEGVHGTAAILLFASLAAAVASHAWPGPFGGVKDQSENWYRWLYRIIFVLMVVGPLIARPLAHEYWVIALEGWEMLLFSIFWAGEAKRTWTRVVSSAPARAV